MIDDDTLVIHTETLATDTIEIQRSSFTEALTFIFIEEMDRTAAVFLTRDETIALVAHLNHLLAPVEDGESLGPVFNPDGSPSDITLQMFGRDR